MLTGGWAEFDGTNDYVRVPYASSFDIGTADFTLAAWVWSSPLIYLSRVGVLELLATAFGEVVVPGAVWAELVEARPTRSG